MTTTPKYLLMVFVIALTVGACAGGSTTESTTASTVAENVDTPTSDRIPGP